MLKSKYNIFVIVNYNSFVAFLTNPAPSRIISMCKRMEKSPSPAYGARLEIVLALKASRGFESLLLRRNIGNKEGFEPGRAASVKKTCRVHVFSEGVRSAPFARRTMMR